jgi:6,7-dimethyl-8-ribityllumazine synthase
MNVLIVAAEFNLPITQRLVDGATSALSAHSAKASVAWVPGSFELPVAAAVAARSKKFDAVICLGAVIRGETPHFDFVAAGAADGIMQLGIETEVPVIFGVLTTDNLEQALARCGVKGSNKGTESAEAAVQMIKTLQQIRVI